MDSANSLYKKYLYVTQRHLAYIIKQHETSHLVYGKQLLSIPIKKQKKYSKQINNSDSFSSSYREKRRPEIRKCSNNFNAFNTVKITNNKGNTN